MLSKIKAALRRLAGGERDKSAAAAPELPAVEYNGFRIRPAPYRANGQYQTAGIIEKDFPDGVKTHRFIRAETHPSVDDAAQFAIAKGKQIIDQQGDRVFS
jgi:hypothetical protein